VELAHVLRTAYRASVGAATLAALQLRARDGRIAVCYGGAFGGDVGGPRVKVRSLMRRFPERRSGYSLLYLLSNALYLPQPVVAAACRAGVPVVLNQNGVFYPAWFPKCWERENARIAKVHAAASHVIYQSEFCRRCAERFLGPRAERWEVFPNAVDTARFRPAEHPRPSRPFTFLVTGNIGAPTAYRLISSIEGLYAARKGGLDVRLVIAGTLDRRVETEARSLAGRLDTAHAVAFRGPYAARQAPAVYQGADAYLMTKHNDPCPNVVLEALACGLPVLYSASGGVPELVGEGAGVRLPVAETFDAVPVPAPLAIAAGMERIIRSHVAMSRAARARAVARFELAAWLDRHAALFARLLAERLPA
jgi:glycosyltransferase involved in cell wall biosynthesis